MQLKNTYQSFGLVGKLVHACIAILTILMLGFGFFLADFHTGTVYTIHKFTGLVILCLALFFTIWYFFNPKPAYPVTMSHFEQTLAKSVQHTMLLLLLIMPLAGWIFTTAAGKPPLFFNIALPMPGIPLSPSLVNIGKLVHYYVAWALIVLVSGHSLAAFKHLLINKDGIMQRMWKFGE